MKHKEYVTIHYYNTKNARSPNAFLQLLASPIFHTRACEPANQIWVEHSQEKIRDLNAGRAKSFWQFEGFLRMCRARGVVYA